MGLNPRIPAVVVLTAHLIINLFLGLAGGGLGALIARGARPAPAVA
jgi:hypothetical protein